MPKPSYAKSCTLPSDLIPLLKERGLRFAHSDRAVDYLSHVGYFRLSAYLRPLYREPKSDHRFKPNATFEQAMSMYRFDRKLRILLFNEIEKIEVAIRCALSNYVSDEVGNVFWMTDPQYFHNRDQFDKTKLTIDTELARTKEDFILHFRRNYSDPYPPAWMIAEILSLGTIGYVYKNLRENQWRKRIAAHFGLTPDVLNSWLEVLGQLRNLCAHHSRVWNREQAIIPANPIHHIYGWIDTSRPDYYRRIYCKVCMIQYFLRSISPACRFARKLRRLFCQYPSIDISAMGFPRRWYNEPVWKGKY